MPPTTMKQWIVAGKDKGFDEMSFGEAPMPKVGENEVLVKFQAASLNYRDLIIPKVRCSSRTVLRGQLTNMHF